MYSPEMATVSLGSAQRYLSDRLQRPEKSSPEDKDKNPLATATPTSKRSLSKNLSEPSPPDTPPSRDSSDSPGSSDEKNSAAVSGDSSTNMTTDINNLATVFANSLPEKAFSPAEIQGFLLTRKRDPLRAIAEVEERCEHTLGARTHETAGEGTEKP